MEVNHVLYIIVTKLNILLVMLESDKEKNYLLFYSLSI